MRIGTRTEQEIMADLANALTVERETNWSDFGLGQVKDAQGYSNQVPYNQIHRRITFLQLELAEFYGLKPQLTKDSYAERVTR